jgi:hypothetical protein
VVNGRPDGPVEVAADFDDIEVRVDVVGSVGCGFRFEAKIRAVIESP